MLKLLSPKRVLIAILFSLWASAASAQQSEVMPPIPTVLQPEPPEPDTLPPPPQLEWGRLAPRDEGGGFSETPVEEVPGPKLETSIATPPEVIVEIPVPGGFDPAQMELVKPAVEVWRGDSEWPQIPPRRFNQLELAYMTGTEPVWLSVQFSEAAAGKMVSARPGPGLTLQPPDGILTVSSHGECLILAQLHESVDQSHIIFNCEGVKTVLPISRATLEVVVAAEQSTGGGQ